MRYFNLKQTHARSNDNSVSLRRINKLNWKRKPFFPRKHTCIDESSSSVTALTKSKRKQKKQFKNKSIDNEKTKWQYQKRVCVEKSHATTHCHANATTLIAFISNHFNSVQQYNKINYLSSNSNNQTEAKINETMKSISNQYQILDAMFSCWWNSAHQQNLSVFKKELLSSKIIKFPILDQANMCAYNPLHWEKRRLIQTNNNEQQTIDWIIRIIRNNLPKK